MTTKRVTDVVPGDRLRLTSGREMTVTRIEHGFLGVDDLICLVEDTDECWFAQALFLTADVETVSGISPRE
jgi:hypothetical protein